VYHRGGKVWVGQNGTGWVALDKDWDMGRLPMDLVEEQGLLGSNFRLASVEQRAELGGYALKNGKWFFYISEQTIQFHGISGQRLYCASNLTNWRPSKEWELLSVPGGYGLFVPKKTMSSEESLSFKFLTETGYWIEPNAQFPAFPDCSENQRNNWFHPDRTGRDLISFDHQSPMGQQGLEKWVHYRPEGEFGYLPGESSSQFRLFAPRAQAVELVVYSDADASCPVYHEMTRSKDGSWSVHLSADFPAAGAYYRYKIRQSDGDGNTFEKLIVDPYARAMLGRDGPGIALLPPKKDSYFVPPAKEDVVLMEVHLRDLLTHAPCDLSSKQRREFDGLSKWLASPGCYLPKMGINVVEFQPVHEFDSRTQAEYHWGYMPVNFFSPASSYASDPGTGEVVEEFSKMVDAFHQAGIAVVLDVVFNHVGIPPHLIHLDRELYFLTDENGELSNHSGCGNDLRCEAGPVKKLILDSLIYWVEHFDVDGFRFDLGELLGMDLLREIEVVLQEIKPGILLFAEPWSFRGRLPVQMNETGYSLWSDACREELLEYAKNHTGNEKVKNLLTGGLDSSNRSPIQSVNYLESHDDYSLVDRFRTIEDWGMDAEVPDEVVRRVMLAMGLLMISPGVPMISAGQDFIRHKCGVRNTYQRGDLNALNYSLLQRYSNESAFIQNLIDLRLSWAGRRARQSCANEWQTHFFTVHSDCAIAFAWESKQTGESCLVVANPTTQEVKLEPPPGWNEKFIPLTGYGADFNDPTTIDPLSFAWYGCEEGS
jgi:pullulanase